MPRRIRSRVFYGFAILGIALVPLLLTGYMTVLFLSEKHDEKPYESMLWSVNQLEIDLLKAALAMSRFGNQPTPETLQNARDGFDILWSRTDLMSRGRVRAFLAEHAAQTERISGVHSDIEVLDRLAARIEGPDNAAIALEVADRLHRLVPAIHRDSSRITNAINQERGEQRQAIIAAMAIAVGILLVFVAAMAIVSMLFVRELRDHRRTLRHRDHALVEAQMANRAKSEFLSSVSHEFRTPLNAILGFSQLLLGPGSERLTPEQRDHVDEIMRAGDTLSGLVADILDLAKIEAGKVSTTLEAVPIGALLQECRSAVQPQASARGITVTEPRIDGMPAVLADPLRLKQALLNLLSNAIKFNREGGTVTIEATTRPEGVGILISDTGRGIPQERVAELFQPFNRLGAEALDIEGTGIGLFVTRKLVTNMGGDIALDRTSPGGSVFRIDLPAAAPATDQKPARLTVVPDTPPATAVVGENAPTPLLYVDDNRQSRVLLDKVIAQQPHLRLVTATTAEEGLILARQEPPAVILLDLNLPGMDGFEALEALRADPRTAHLPVIAVTANALPETAMRAEEAGFDGFVTKPLDVKAFLETVNRTVPARSALAG